MSLVSMSSCHFLSSCHLYLCFIVPNYFISAYAPYYYGLLTHQSCHITIIQLCSYVHLLESTIPSMSSSILLHLPTCILKSSNSGHDPPILCLSQTLSTPLLYVWCDNFYVHLWSLFRDYNCNNCNTVLCHIVLLWQFLCPIVVPVTS